MKKEFIGKENPLEKSHDDAPLEWWFVQGTFVGKNIGPVKFMTCLFKNKIEGGKSASKYSFSYIQSVLDSRTDRQEIVSDTDDYFIPLIRSKTESIKNLNINQRYIDRFLADLEKHGFPREISLNTSPVRIQSSPFEIRRDPFFLGQNGREFQLKFSATPIFRSGKFRFHSNREPLNIQEAMDLGGKGEGMRCHTYPRMELTGNIDGQPVRGQAWLDHQWGKHHAFPGKNRKKYLLGWDWFGINFEDGTDWVVGVYRNAQSGRILSRLLYAIDPSGRINKTSSFSVRPIGHWESSRTLIRYPVEWRLLVPEWKARVVFQPDRPDQEIPVLGLMRAIWEGSGRVTGTIGGKPIQGSARGEFQGYGYLFDHGQFLQSLQLRIEKQIKDFFPKKIEGKTILGYTGRPKWKQEPDAYTPVLAEPVWEILSRRGKMWRPAFGMILLNALGVDPQPYESFICNMGELAHVGSLIIDDIEDNSLLRRGDECIHLIYGQDVAINAANTLYFLPMLKLIGHDHLSERQQLGIHQVLVKQFVRAHLGQAHDIYWSRLKKSDGLNTILQDSPLPKVLQMYEYKSAAIIEGLAEVAAIIARSEDQILQACRDFARDFGVAFQIIDDVHNFSGSSRWRKECGEDLMEGKLTYVIIQALNRLSGSERDQLLDIVDADRKELSVADIREGVKLVRQTGVLETSRSDAQRIVRPSADRLSEKLAFSESKIFLLSLCEDLLNLDFKE